MNGAIKVDRILVAYDRLELIEKLNVRDYLVDNGKTVIVHYYPHDTFHNSQRWV